MRECPVSPPDPPPPWWCVNHATGDVRKRWCRRTMHYSRGILKQNIHAIARVEEEIMICRFLCSRMRVLCRGFKRLAGRAPKNEASWKLQQPGPPLRSVFLRYGDCISDQRCPLPKEYFFPGLNSVLPLCAVRSSNHLTPQSHERFSQQLQHRVNERMRPKDPTPCDFPERLLVATGKRSTGLTHY